ncbi:hypothetical protein Bca4012_020884 [Brassica carinata]
MIGFEKRNELCKNLHVIEVKKNSTFPFVLNFGFSQRFLCVSADKSTGIYDLHLLSVQSSSSLAAHKQEGEILSTKNFKSFTFNKLDFGSDSVVG